MTAAQMAAAPPSDASGLSPVLRAAGVCSLLSCQPISRLYHGSQYPADGIQSPPVIMPALRPSWTRNGIGPLPIVFSLLPRESRAWPVGGAVEAGQGVGRVLRGAQRCDSGTEVEVEPG